MVTTVYLHYMNDVGLYSFDDGLTCLNCYKLTVYMTLYVLHV